jgi:hypothetical protein
MRQLAHFSLLLISCAVINASTGVVSDYQTHTDKLCHDAVFAEFEKHPERWDKLSMKLRFRIDAAGRIHDIRILSGVPNRWAEGAARRALSELKLPPVPKQVMQATGMNGCNAEAEFAVSKNPADASKVLRAHSKLRW